MYELTWHLLISADFCTEVFKTPRSLGTDHYEVLVH